MPWSPSPIAGRSLSLNPRPFCVVVHSAPLVTALETPGAVIDVTQLVAQSSLVDPTPCTLRADSSGIAARCVWQILSRMEVSWASLCKNFEFSPEASADPLGSIERRIGLHSRGCKNRQCTCGRPALAGVPPQVRVLPGEPVTLGLTGFSLGFGSVWSRWLSGRVVRGRPIV